MMTSYNKILFLSEGNRFVAKWSENAMGINLCLYSKILPKSRSLNICCYEIENLAISKV